MTVHSRHPEHPGPGVWIRTRLEEDSKLISDVNLLPLQPVTDAFAYLHWFW